MKHEIEGVVLGVEAREGSESGDCAVSFRLPRGPELIWRVGAWELDRPGIPKLAPGDPAGILWDDDACSAELVFPAAPSVRLERDYGRGGPGSGVPVERVDLLACASCGGAVPLGGGEIAECPYCAARVPLAGAHLEAARLSAGIRKDNEKLFAELTGIFSGGMRPGLFKALSVVPLALLSLQILILAYGTFFGKLGDFFSDEIVDDFLMDDANFALVVVLPSLLLTAAWVFASRKSALALDVRHLAILFSPRVTAEGELRCRSCESPLASAAIPDLVVCPHCRIENLVTSARGAFDRTAAALKTNHLADMRILHGEFRRSYKKFFVQIAIGLVVFYGSFFAFTCYWDDMRHVHFIARYIAMPFVVLVLLQLLAAIALLPFQGFDDWVPKYFKKSLAGLAAQRSERKRPLSGRIVPAIAIALFLLFFVTLFFMK